MIEVIENIRKKVFDVLVENENIVVVLLIGSYARQTQKANSDIDLMIVTRDKERLLSQSNWIHQFGSIKTRLVAKL
jgi:predicted nucleotidyltransferase